MAKDRGGPSPEEAEQHLKLKGWEKSAGGTWQDPQGSGDWSREEAWNIQRQRDEAEKAE